MIAVVGWAVILGACLVWETIALLHPSDAWPTLSDIMRAITRPLLGRWVVFALWLWSGWHLFVRGWQLFLRTLPRPDGDASSESGDGTAVGPLGVPASLADAPHEPVVALVLAYAVVVALLAFGARRVGRLRRVPRHDADQGSRESASRLVTHVVVTTTCGYAVFVAAVGIYDALADGGTGDLWADALAGGGFLAFVVAAPAFAVLSLAERALRR